MLKVISQEVDAAARIVWDYMLLKQPLEKADAIFALGSTDLRVAEYAARLYLDKWAPLIIFSGYSGHGKTLGEGDVTEAEKFFSIAKDMGVPEKDILLEKEATNTGENILFTKRLLEKKNISVHKLILVQKPYMERRTYATFAKQWPDMEFVVTSPQISFDEYPFNSTRSKEPFITTMVGDLQRIKEYPAKGYQIEQEIPERVWSAYEELVAAGYTEHLIDTDVGK